MFHAQRRVNGLRLIATDTDWTVGAGDEVAGRRIDLLLLLTGRPAALSHSTGTAPSVSRRPKVTQHPVGHGLDRGRLRFGCDLRCLCAASDSNPNPLIPPRRLLLSMPVGYWICF
jgi:hypothetical protein